MKSVEIESITRVLCPSVILLANERQLLPFLHGSDLSGQMCRDFHRVLLKIIFLLF